VGRYFFHVVGGTLPIEDDEGTRFRDTSDAVAHAEMIANELALDVVDERQQVIARVPIIRRAN
jgi:hypothetical protein